MHVSAGLCTITKVQRMVRWSQHKEKTWTQSEWKDCTRVTVE